MLVTVDNFTDVIGRLQSAREIVVDLETTGLNPWGSDRLCGIAVLVGDESYYFPFRHACISHTPLFQGILDDNINLPLDLLRVLGAELNRPDKVYVGYNYKFDLSFLAAEGITPPKMIEDVMIAAHLVNENEPNYRLKSLSDFYLDDDSSAEEKQLAAVLRSRKLTGKGDMWKLAPEEVAPYAEKDVILTRALRDFYLSALEEQELLDLWREYNNFSLAILDMEKQGIRIDPDRLNDYIEEAEIAEQQQISVIQEMAGKPINPASSQQMQDWLQVESTASGILEKLGKDREDITALLQFRAWSKVRGTYYDRFAQSMDHRQVIHPNLRITGTVSGRLSCNNPNMQAIPRYNNVYKVKDVFVSSPGRTFVEADYSQAEIRVATHFARECNMAEILLKGVDMHSATAENIGIPRDIAKRLNFSVIYGVGARSLSENLDIPLKEARRYLGAYHRQYPGFKRLYNQAESVAEERGFIKMFTGRRRHYNDDARAPVHKASSNLVQGSVAEMVRTAITRLHALKDKGVHMLLTVHDSILFEVDDNVLDWAIDRIRFVMEDQPWCSVKLPVDIKIGKRWGDLEELPRKEKNHEG